MTRLELLAVLCRDLAATSRRLDEARLVAEFLRDLDAVLAAHDGRTALEYKYDGARIQLHRAGDRVAVWTRGLADVTASLPDVVEIARRDLTGAPFVLDGEVVALDAPASGGGRP
jgi:DNA ligase-1